jgi:hypothetical protein
MPIPRERHEKVRAGKQHDGKPAGLNEFIHIIICL